MTLGAVDEDGNPQMYPMRRAAQGSINSSTDLSIALQEVLKPMLGKCALVCIDDVLLFARAAKGLVDAHAQLHSLIKSVNVKVKLSKAEVYTEEARGWVSCLTKDGVRQDGSRIQGQGTGVCAASSHRRRALVVAWQSGLDAQPTP